MLERRADAERVELWADRAQGAGLGPGVVCAEAVDTGLRILDEAVSSQDGAGCVTDGRGGNAAVLLPGQDDPIRLGRLDAAEGVVPDLGERGFVAGEQVAGDLLGSQEWIVRERDAVGLGYGAVRLVGQCARGDGGNEESVAFVVSFQDDELGSVRAAQDGCLLEWVLSE